MSVLRLDEPCLQCALHSPTERSGTVSNTCTFQKMLSTKLDIPELKLRSNLCIRGVTRLNSTDEMFNIDWRYFFIYPVKHLNWWTQKCSCSWAPPSGTYSICGSESSPVPLRLNHLLSLDCSTITRSEFKCAQSVTENLHWHSRQPQLFCI